MSNMSHKNNIFRSDGLYKVFWWFGYVYNPKWRLSTVNHGGGVLVWACMGSVRDGGMEFIQGTMDHKVWTDILKQNLRQNADTLGIGVSFYFYQDNNPKHTALNTRLCLLYNVPQLLNSPSQSPYLNHIVQ